MKGRTNVSAFLIFLSLAGGALGFNYIHTHSDQIVGMITTPAQASFAQADASPIDSAFAQLEHVPAISKASSSEVANIVRIHDCLWHLEWTESRGMPLEARRLAVYSAIARAADNKPEFGGSDECAVVYKKSKGVSQYSGPSHYPLVRTGKEAEESSRIVWEVMLGEWRPKGEEARIRYYLNRRYSAAKSIAWFDKATKLVREDGGHEYRRAIEPGEARDEVTKAVSKVRHHKKRRVRTASK